MLKTEIGGKDTEVVPVGDENTIKWSIGRADTTVDVVT